jgi:hypothetical protein
VPHKPRLVGGVKGHNINEISFPGSPALWAGSFTFAQEGGIVKIQGRVMELDLKKSRMIVNERLFI